MGKFYESLRTFVGIYPTLDDPPATDPESIELSADGERVIFKYDGTYEIVSSGLLVRRIP
jgi:hypothetical protein